MNTMLLEELVRRKAQSFRSDGASISEALDRAGEEILTRFGAGQGHGSRFCLRMCLQAAKARIAPECQCESNNAEGDKRGPLINHSTLAI
ncbi:hypothetical protein SAMN05660337_0278 [Maridesulfovibrio ferrireducens]|uniref:Uncharacterized protein n=1 Tax=Maridesulfovibrio ferrireducens TaxID=246191 RepID=A0A1G9BFL4_9BACT|nr:hypothetical protein [Maridesulfovibrio ferrireducens]SDK38309.1 hypothetical protein SAMN05660337_0278 [Maridesulfovibrio ferrireducens]